MLPLICLVLFAALVASTVPLVLALPPPHTASIMGLSRSLVLSFAAITCILVSYLTSDINRTLIWNLGLIFLVIELLRGRRKSAT